MIICFTSTSLLREASKKKSYLFTMQAVFDIKPQGNTSLLFKER